MQSSSELSYFSSALQHHYYGYQLTFSSINYSEYPKNNYHIVNNYTPYYQDPMPDTARIYVNPFFQPSVLNSTNTLSTSFSSSSSLSVSQIEQNLSSSSSNRTRSPSPDRKIMIPTKKRKNRFKRKNRHKQLIREKELMFKRKPIAIPKQTLSCSSSNLLESKEEKFHRLYEQYSNEDTLETNWKPLSLDECTELYQYAFKQHRRKSKAK